MNEAVFIGSRSTSANLPWLPVDFATIGGAEKGIGFATRAVRSAV
jgi:hypothetical protein